MSLATRLHAGRAATALVVAALLSAVLAFVPGIPATAQSDGGVQAQGTLGQGYALVASDGGIFNYGDSEFFGSTGNINLNKPIVGMEYTPSGEGYWLVASDGGIFNFGDAPFLGSTGAIKLNSPIVGMASTITGDGYWLVASDGGIFAFGDAVFRGSTGALKLNKPIVAMAAHPSGEGYWLVASDGGIFTFGDPAVVKFWGSQGGKPLNKPIVDMEATETGNGYWMVATDGGIFTFGDADFLGSQGARALNQPINGMSRTPSGQGYYMVASDGGIFTHGDAVFRGSRGGAPLNKPVVGMAVTPFSPVTAPDFIVKLEGEQEVPGPGDPDGTGTAFLDFTNDELCYFVQPNAIQTATAAHIHEAPAGVSGPVVIDLGKPDSRGVFQGCVDVATAQATEILADPQRYYVNVHNAEYPNGAVRGQLADELILGSTSDNEVFAFFSSTPETLVAGPIKVTGLGTGEVIIGHDARPKTDELYVITRVAAQTTGRIYKVDDAGKATRIGTEANNITITGQGVGFDFNPAADRIRIVTPADENYRVNPDTGAVATSAGCASQTSMPASDCDINPDSDLSGAAYTNSGRSSTQPTTTRLYAVDHVDDTLVIVNPANSGTVTEPKPLGRNIDFSNGFDIGPAPEGEAGTFVLTVASGDTGTTDVYVLSPETGKATLLGAAPKFFVATSVA